MKGLILAALFLATPAHAANERAKRDVNKNPVLIGISELTGEVRNIRVTEDGFLLVKSTGVSSLSGTVQADQGVGGASAWLMNSQQLGAWSMTILNGAGGSAVNIQDGGNSITVDASALDIRALTNADVVTIEQATHDSLNLNANLQVGNVDVANGNPVPISDGGGSITVDGAFDSTGSSISVANVAGTSLAINDDGGSLTVDGTVAATQSGTWILGANSGVDIGDVTINNGGAASAVNVQDGGNVLSVDDGGASLTVDAVDLDIRDLASGTDSVASVQSGAWTVTANAGTGIFDTTGSTVSIEVVGGGSLPIDDNGGSITVDDGGTTLSIDDGGGSLTVDGTVTANQGGTWVLGTNSGVDIGDVTINNATGAGAVNIQDGGNSLTVDDGGGSLTVDAVDLDVRDLTSASDSVEILQATHDNLNLNANLQVGNVDVANGNPVPISDAGTTLSVDDGGGALTVDGTVAATQSGTWILGANSGVDIGDTTINNASGASAVNIQDGGNSITVDGTITANAGSGTFNQDLTTVGGNATATGSGVITSGTQRVVLATDQPVVSIDDNGGSLTVDGTVAATQSGAWTVTANAGTGNFAMNQTQVSGTAIDTDAGNSSAGTQRVVIASDQPAIAVTSTPDSWTVPQTSTGTCATGSATLAITSNSSSKTTGFCNEGTASVRVGASGVSGTIGFLVRADTCIGMDGPLAAFQGELYCQSTDGSTQAFSVIQGE